MLTARQIREARHMLAWDAETLARYADVGCLVIEDAETEGDRWSVTRFHFVRIQIALERAGIRFGQNGAVLMGIRNVP